MEKENLKRNWFLFNICPFLIILYFLFQKNYFSAIILIAFIIAINLIYVFVCNKDVDETFFGGKIGDKFNLGFSLKRSKKKDNNKISFDSLFHFFNSIIKPTLF